MSEILKFAPDFKEIVLKHAQQQLPRAEWERLRARSGDARISHSDCVEAGFVSQSLSVEEIWAANFKSTAVDIGAICDQSVWYVSGAGFYVWSMSPTHPESLCVWLTHPAYPEGW